MPSPDDRPEAPFDRPSALRGSELLGTLLDQARRQNGLAIADMVGHDGRAGLALALTALSTAAMVPLPGLSGLCLEPV